MAIEVIRGQKTTAELASQHEIHPTMINNWKRDLLDKASELFDNGKIPSQAQSEWMVVGAVMTTFSLHGYGGQ